MSLKHILSEVLGDTVQPSGLIPPLNFQHLTDIIFH